MSPEVFPNRVRSMTFDRGHSGTAGSANSSCLGKRPSDPIGRDAGVHREKSVRKVSRKIRDTVNLDDAPRDVGDFNKLKEMLKELVLASCTHDEERAPTLRQRRLRMNWEYLDCSFEFCRLLRRTAANSALRTRLVVFPMHALTSQRPRS
jgi:hypothetical protein